MSPTFSLILGDAIRTKLPDKSVDLVIGSPPYEIQRLYSVLKFALKGQAWVDWMVAGFKEWLRICRGPVIMVIEGFTEDFAYSATPFLLGADLHRAGITLRKAPIYHRVGIPGSGGPDWLRNDYEFYIVATNGGRLPFSDPTVMGHLPKYGPGGAMSHRLANGSRRNQWGGTPTATGMQGRRRNGKHKKNGRPAERYMTITRDRPGQHAQTTPYTPPKLANPGNVISEKYTAAQVAAMAQFIIESGDVTKHIVGGGVMGHPLAHENEAPFPETLPDFFIRSFCPPGGTVFDPFCGSGSTGAAALKAGRNFIGIDARFSQIKIATRRLREVSAALQAEVAK